MARNEPAGWNTGFGTPLASHRAPRARTSSSVMRDRDDSAPRSAGSRTCRAHGCTWGIVVK